MHIRHPSKATEGKIMAGRRGTPAAIHAALSGVILMLWACATAPVIGRPKLHLVLESEEVALRVNAYHQILAKANPGQHPQDNGLVDPVGRRIANGRSNHSAFITSTVGLTPNQLQEEILEHRGVNLANKALVTGREGGYSHESALLQATRRFGCPTVHRCP
jgi:hypothetical protein